MFVNMSLLKSKSTDEFISNLKQSIKKDPWMYLGMGVFNFVVTYMGWISGPLEIIYIISGALAIGLGIFGLLPI